MEQRRVRSGHPTRGGLAKATMAKVACMTVILRHHAPLSTRFSKPIGTSATPAPDLEDADV